VLACCVAASTQEKSEPSFVEGGSRESRTNKFEMMEDGEVALNGLADLPKESEPTKDVAPEKSDLEAPLSPQNTSSPDHKRKRENKDETTGSPKRHKEHKHKKHKKHKKEKKSSSPEATHRERGASGSRSPSPKVTPHPSGGLGLQGLLIAQHDCVNQPTCCEGATSVGN